MGSAGLAAIATSLWYPAIFAAIRPLRVDSLSTVVLEEKMAKVLAWYDNEWGYSCRVADLAAFMAKVG